MKKETFTEKLIKRTYGISEPLDEYKRREADRIGNQVFIILFYLMIFGNLIPLLLAYKFPQLVALVYPPLILVIALIAASYLTYQMQKTGITTIEPDMLNQKEKKQLRYPGLKAGLVYGILMFFGMPLLNVLTDDNKNYFTSLFNLGHFTSILFAAFFFGLMMQLVVWLRIRKAKEDQDDN